MTTSISTNMSFIRSTVMEAAAPYQRFEDNFQEAVTSSEQDQFGKAERYLDEAKQALDRSKKCIERMQKVRQKSGTFTEVKVLVSRCFYIIRTEEKRIANLRKNLIPKEFCCSICKDPLEDELPLYHAPRKGYHCGHNFHKICIERALEESGECPSCKKRAEFVDFVANDAILKQARLYRFNPKNYYEHSDEKDLMPEEYRNIPRGVCPVSFYERCIEPLSDVGLKLKKIAVKVLVASFRVFLIIDRIFMLGIMIGAIIGAPFFDPTANLMDVPMILFLFAPFYWMFIYLPTEAFLNEDNYARNVETTVLDWIMLTLWLIFGNISWSIVFAGLVNRYA